MTQVPLTQQVAAVVGATSDIGRAVALRLAAEGAHVCLLGRDPNALEDVAASVRGLTNKVFVQPIDLASRPRSGTLSRGWDVTSVR